LVRAVLARDYGLAVPAENLYAAPNQSAQKGACPVSHEKRIVHCAGPHDPHALHGIPVMPRSGNLDALCAVCAGHGQWNREIDLVSQRSKRHVCDACDGRGWVETGDDLVHSHDIEMSADGYPKWITRLDPPDPID
jgi:hypothetical protein